MRRRFRFPFEVALELFSSFRIPYEQYVDLELLFSMRLHITPEELGRMFFYDIMLLYHRYEEYVKEENENQKQQQSEYEMQHDDMRAEMESMSRNMSSFSSGMNIPSFNPGSFGL